MLKQQHYKRISDYQDKTETNNNLDADIKIEIKLIS